MFAGLRFMVGFRAWTLTPFVSTILPPLMMLLTGSGIGNVLMISDLVIPSSPRTELAIKTNPKVEKSSDSGLKDKKKKKKRRSKDSKKEKDPGLQLLAHAAQVRESRKEEETTKDQSRKSSGGSGKVKELVKALLGSKSKQSKERSKKKSKRDQGGGDPGSSNGSSEYSEEGSESSDSEMLAPLQRKSSKRPGAVLKMLILHAKHALDQTSVVEAKEASDITTGVHLISI